VGYQTAAGSDRVKVARLIVAGELEVEPIDDKGAGGDRPAVD